MAPPSPRATSSTSIIKESPTWLHHLQGLHHQQASSRHLQHGSTISKGYIINKHHQGISNMAPPSPRATSSTSIIKASPTWLHHLQGLHHQQAGSISIITINHTMSKHHGLHHIIRILMGPSSTHQPYKGPSGSWTYLQGSNRVKTMIIMSTSINPATSYCDHYKGHHKVTRFHITIVGIKDKHQTSVGINDKLQQQGEINDNYKKKTVYLRKCKMTITRENGNLSIQNGRGSSLKMMLQTQWNSSSNLKMVKNNRSWE